MSDYSAGSGGMFLWPTGTAPWRPDSIGAKG